MSMSFEREVITDLFTVVPDRRLKQKQNEASNDKNINITIGFEERGERGAEVLDVPEGILAVK